MIYRCANAVIRPDGRKCPEYGVLRELMGSEPCTGCGLAMSVWVMPAPPVQTIQAADTNQTGTVATPAEKPSRKDAVGADIAELRSKIAKLDSFGVSVRDALMRRIEELERRLEEGDFTW
jgi:anti-sigma28 factor (negative regulator of flagellin synthesis)